MPKYPPPANRRGGSIAQWLLGKNVANFHHLSLKRCVSVYIFKVEEAVEFFKTIGGSSPIFALSNHTTFSQTQTGTSVPLTLYNIP